MWLFLFYIRMDGGKWIKLTTSADEFLFYNSINTYGRKGMLQKYLLIRYTETLDVLLLHKSCGGLMIKICY